MASISPSLILLLTILSLSSLLSFSTALVIDGGSVRTGGLIAGSWKKIDPNDPIVRDIGEFAVYEHDKEAKDSLKFQKVVSGESQVVAGTNYKLIIAASNGVGGITSNYEAVVYDKPWKHFRQLLSFKKV